MANILHIAERSAWEAARASGRYAPPSLEAEGFIHCSTPGQVVGTANAFFRGRRGLVLLCIDEERVGAALRYEAAAGAAGSAAGGGALFPHLYGPLPVQAVARVVDFPCGGDGTFALPAALVPLAGD